MAYGKCLAIGTTSDRYAHVIQTLDACGTHNVCQPLTRHNDKLVVGASACLCDGEIYMCVDRMGQGVLDQCFMLLM